jgi:hypothetical protein
VSKETYAVSKETCDLSKETDHIATDSTYVLSALILRKTSSAVKVQMKSQPTK